MKASFFVLALSFLGIVNSQRRPSWLNYRQRYPNDDESKICGRIRDVIPRNSGRYRKILIRNTNNDAEYANDDCRRMTARAKSKLDTLASRTKAKWSGIKVRVMKAWTDQVDPNDRTSLHYEGRSLRLQTSDGDRGKLGLLAGVALEAGFDWVEYTNPYYIRASVIPDVCQTSVDLVFLLDGSGSVGIENFQKVKEFVKKVVDFFNIGRSGTHMAVVQYSTNTVTEFALDRYFTKSEMKRAVDRIPYQSGWTYTAEALKFLRWNIFTPQAGMRTDAGIPKVLVLLTDGHSQGDAVGPPGQALKNIGISIFSIGVGSGVSIQQLNEIASDPDSEYVFQRTFDNLIAGWVDRLSAVSCSEGSLINSCDEAITSVESGSFKYFRTQFQFITGNQVSVELRDKTGVSHLYASAKSKNPGPLDPDSVKNEKYSSPKAVSVRVDSTKTVFVAVQGQRDTNTFSLSFWDNLFANTNYYVNVVENKAAQFIYALRMASNSNRLRFKITDGNSEGAFRIDSSSPRIYTTKRLDREKTEKYNLVIVAENENNKCHKSRTNVVVTVGDENDNSPKFTENPYRENIYENAQIGNVVRTVKATDADTGINGRVTYSITSSGDTFQINNQGQITLKGRLNYESVQSYAVNLEAVDGGNRKATSELIVTVLNINEPPSIRCNNANCKYSVIENVLRGTGFGAQMIGTDPDTKTSCNLQYALPSSVKNQFSIDAKGWLKTNGDLDRELKPHYGFFVTVRDCGGLTDNVYVTVNIGDENDNSPQFPGPYTVDILESEQPASNVVQVNARDADENDNAKISYSMTGADSSAFQIDAATGRITTKSRLDYETKRSYQFEVVASDHGQSVRQGTTRVTVNVVDVNDNKPIFGGSYIKEVPEGAARGTHVITVQATDRDSGPRGEVRYSIVSGNIGNAFSVNGISGLITVNAQLDRETRSSYSLVLQASDRGSPSMNARATVTIVIGDVNDNSPRFEGLPYTRSVPEDISTSEVILKVLATDKDSGSFGKVSYRIKSPSVAQQTFKIDGNGSIGLKKNLDYEKTKDYTFTIVARDGGGRETEDSVTIYVEDVNDNTPKFEKNPYTASVAENAKVGYIVGTVKATDSDSGPRGRVSYSITARNNGNAFRINAGGSVSVASALDRETKASYTLTIKAQDDGTPVKSSTTRFTITVSDINDNKPTFKQTSYSFNIVENNKQDDLVGGMGLATDADTGVNADIDYSIVSGNVNAAFEFETNSGNLIAKKVLDREQIASYSLVIEARDKGQPALYTRVPVQVAVEDENDNDPKFTQDSYNCTIDENSAQNSRVCFVRATDADIGKNGKVVYELVSPSNEFSVSQNDGEIKTKLSLDRETKASYTLDIKAKDLGNPSKNSTVKVTVKVIDKNDNEPKFGKNQYSFEVKEDASVGSKIDQVSASDADEGLSGQVVYQIIKGNVKSAFSIDKDTGYISVKSKLDRETLANYELTIRASDRGIPQQSSSMVVPIKILDVNDNVPKFTSSEYSGRIAEDAFVGSSVVQVTATDADEGINSQIKYSITTGVNKEHFSIHEDSGLIKTATKLDYETKKSYQLTVKATDQGTPSKSSTSTVNIDVKNTNDNAPTFVPGSPIVHISEAVAIGTKVVKFNATDEDGNKLTFSLTKGNTNDALTIDQDSGLLTTKTTLDRETVPLYNLTVTVTESTNSGANGQWTSQNLTVVVTDENDNGPVFDPKVYTKDIVENEPAGVLLTVKATDKDSGKNAEISFSIDSVSAAKFSINNQTGAISTKARLDREESARYVITVTARDSGIPSLSSTATVTVNVNDLNDNKPRFKSDYTTTFRENTAKGRTVLRVEATDPDSDTNGEIIYSLTSGNELGYFALNSTNGVITVAKPPDREQTPSFTLNVRASNKRPYVPSTPVAKTDCTVIVTIEDANDNPPVITNTVTSVQVEENSPANTQVLDVNATDADAGVNREIEYEIVHGNVNDAFKIDRGSGVISTRGVIDRETIDSYTLKIQASDKGSPRLFSTKDFTVVVTDVDDNAPVFNPSNYDESVLESANLSTPVLRLQATDKDININARISFSIASGNDQDHFKLDRDSGVISIKALLDYEKTKEYNLVVQAKDTKHTSQASVVIRVVNINDNAPVFKPKSYSVSIPENQPLDKTILTVTATDADPFGELMYSIDPPSNMFTVDPSNGQLSAVSELDRETTDYYKLTIRVTDGGTPALSDSTFVEINITDINDNSPIFNSSPKDISVRENSPVDTVLLTLSAVDKDIGVNAELRYRIAAGNEADKFKLDEVSGVLSVKGNIDRENVAAFRLEILAQDQGTPSLDSKPRIVAINVLDENDNSPVFTKDTYEQNVTENLSGGVFVEDVEATDADIGANGQVTYAIVSGAEGYFRIDSNTGIVETTRPLDREHISLFVIKIEARDQGNPSRNSTAVLQVNVLDANDNPPRLDNVVANVTEEQPAGEFVTRIAATDPDQGTNGEVEYSLTIRGSQSLKINPTTGVVTTRVRFDYEEQKNHTFKVIATDKGNPSLSTTADLIINVVDIDDNCPVFNPKEYNVTIEENLPFLTDIVQVFATDIDTVGENLEYGIRSGNIAGTFRINQTSATIQAGVSVDREIAAEYNLIVRAGNEYCGVNLTGPDIDESVETEFSKSIAKVNIFLTDLNDNAPVFLKDSYKYELTDIFTESLLWLNATDPDEGLNAEFDFALAGVTRVGSKRTLIVTATDKGTPPLTSNTTVDVTGVKCEAMQFSVSARGRVTVKTLCKFDKVVVPEDAFVGQSATFNCSAQGNTVAEYRWYRNSVPVTDWLKKGEYKIKTLTKNDEGVYSCIAASEAGNMFSEGHKFRVKEPAKVTVHPEDIWVEVGKKANLSCRASGDELIKYRWFKNNYNIQSSADVTADEPDLVFVKTIPEDEQVYHCEVSNYPDAKADKSKSARLEVYTPDAVVELELTVNKPRHKESCQYFNITTIEETIEGLINGEMAVVEFVKPTLICNLTACSSDPCLNNGRCQPKGSDFVCHCPREWTGKQCDIDVNECKTESCDNNGTCVNSRGSFYCDCPKSTKGKLCQFTNKICSSNPCAQGKCYPKEWKQGYECLDDVRTVDMVFKLDGMRTPFKDWMVYDVAKEIENTINDAAVIQTRDGGRTRRDTNTVDYSGCSVRVTQFTARNTELDLQIMFVCAQPPDKKYVCDAMFKQNKVASCTDENGVREATPTTEPPAIAPQRVTLAFIVRKPNGKDMVATETVSALREGNLDDELSKYNMFDIALRARSINKGRSGEQNAGISSAAITGVAVGVVVLIIVAIMAALLIIRSRHRNDKEFSIGRRAILSRTQSADAMIKQNINMRELENAEVRGVNNKTFSEIYEEYDGLPRDLEDGSFMVENPQLALKKQDQEYMKELESSPWFHGSISRSEAEDMLDATGNKGTFLVRSGLDMGEFYISVRTPNAEPKFRHISVNRRGGDFVAVCGSNAEAQNFRTFNELVDYLRANPIHIEGVVEDVLLKDHVAKV